MQPLSTPGRHIFASGRAGILMDEVRRSFSPGCGPLALNFSDAKLVSDNDSMSTSHSRSNSQTSDRFSDGSSTTVFTVSHAHS